MAAQGKGDVEVAVDEPRVSHARSWQGLGWGFLIKLLAMMVVNAAGLAAIMSAVNAQAWVIMGASIVLLVAADIIYFAKRTLPLKYLYPGLVFLFIFQIFTMGYTAYIAFTNYGAGHTLTMEQAADTALIQDERPIPDSPEYPASVVTDGEQLALAINDEGIVAVGTAEQPPEPVNGASVSESGQPVEVPGWQVLGIAELSGMQDDVNQLRVPVSDDAEDGSLRTRDGRRALVYESWLVWDPVAETITDTETGTVYTADQTTGNFVAPDGTMLLTGWHVNVGFANFAAIFTDASLTGPLLKVTAWTFAFAILTVLTSFGLGLLLALIYNDPRVRGQKILRTVFILPYAFPAFLSALLWRGMLNPEFGVVNEWFFGGLDINWLGDPWLAKFAILWVNLWLSFPYWFLVCTGALQALPGETLEAARVDGAGRWRQFRSITLPLLMISTAPLAIASFAFNFNNFTIIYMLTEGGPPFPNNPNGLGSTDILISAIYQVSGVQGGTQDYGLASALSILVFIVVGVISAIAFRQTRKLEEIQ